MYPLFDILLLRHRCGFHYAERYVVPPDIWLLDVGMHGALTLVMMLCIGYHRKLSMLLPLFFFVPYFYLRYSIYCWILYYTVLAASAVYIFVTDG